MIKQTAMQQESQLIDDDVSLTLIELCQACKSSEVLVTTLVVEGVLEPSGEQPQEWRFSGASLRRVRMAQRLTQDLEVNVPGVALALDLLDQIEMLKAQLTRSGLY